VKNPTKTLRNTLLIVVKDYSDARRENDKNEIPRKQVKAMQEYTSS